MSSDNGKELEMSIDDELLMERLEALYDKHISDIRAFSERENRPFEEIRQCVAQWHCKYLFDDASSPSASVKEQKERILRSTSQTLESLQQAAGLQSFFLVVNPYDPADIGFLGGTIQGREFWRGHRGCGEPGALAFKAQCVKAAQDHARSPYATAAGMRSPSLPPPLPPPPSGTPREPSFPYTAARPRTASALKADVYASVRNAVRAASGVRNAEMKWSDHAKLGAYGIRVEGWPPGLPITNPSSLSAAQNQRVLDALHTGALHFVRTDDTQPPAAQPSGQDLAEDAEVADSAFDISWACEVPPDDPESSSSVSTTPYPISHQGLAFASREATPFSPFAYATQPAAPADDTGIIPRKRSRDET